jgi:hypothetical protein
MYEGRCQLSFDAEIGISAVKKIWFWPSPLNSKKNLKSSPNLKIERESHPVLDSIDPMFRGCPGNPRRASQLVASRPQLEFKVYITKLLQHLHQIGRLAQWQGAWLRIKRLQVRSLRRSYSSIALLLIHFCGYCMTWYDHSCWKWVLVAQIFGQRVFRPLSERTEHGNTTTTPGYMRGNYHPTSGGYVRDLWTRIIRFSIFLILGRKGKSRLVILIAAIRWTTWTKPRGIQGVNSLWENRRGDQRKIDGTEFHFSREEWAVAAL